MHLACFLGKFDVLEILDIYFNADFNTKTILGLSGLHCAALNERGIVSIHYLKESQKEDFNVDI